MRNNYKFTLCNKRGGRNICPKCQRKTFTRYVDNDTGECIAQDVGMCSRLKKCQYHYPPREYFLDNKKEPRNYGSNNQSTRLIIRAPKVKSIYTLSENYLCESMNNELCSNSFTDFFIDIV